MWPVIQLCCVKAVPVRKSWVFTLLLSGRERHSDGWLQSEASEIEMRVNTQDFNRLVVDLVGETSKESRQSRRFQIKPSCIPTRNVAQTAHQNGWGDSLAEDLQHGILQCLQWFWSSKISLSFLNSMTKLCELCLFHTLRKWESAATRVSTGKSQSQVTLLVVQREFISKLR